MNVKNKKSNIQLGFSLIEVILATSIFGFVVTALVGVFIYGQESIEVAGCRARAVILAEEGLEAARNMRDGDFNNLTAGTHGLGLLENQWVFSGSQDIVDSFVRQITVSNIDASRKLVVSNITWQQNSQRTGTVSLETIFTNWSSSPVPDTIPPSAVTLIASNSTADSVDLSWIAPGDDGVLGTATLYDMRYSTSLITEANWALATPATGEPNPPSVAGSNESMTVSGLMAGTTYYFALKTSDEVPNISALSNVPSAATKAGQSTYLVVDTATASIDPGDNSKVIGITIKNSGGSNITIDKMTISWSGGSGGTKLKEININGGLVWSGNNNSGGLADIADFTLVSGAGAYPISFIDFSKSMSGTTINIIFTMADSSTKTVIGILP